MPKHKPDEQLIGHRIKAAREQFTNPKMSQEDLARLVGVKQQTVQELEAGRSRTTRFILKFATALKQDPEWLETGKGQMRKLSAPQGVSGVKPALNVREPQGTMVKTLRVVGAAQAGEWLETLEWPLDEQYEVPWPIPAGFRGLPVQVLEVRGPSMNELYPHGSLIAVVSFIDLGRDPRHGERVVALRLRPGEFEATVKEYRIDTDGKQRLWPRSTHPDFQQPVLVTPPDDEDGVRIAYLVIGSFRPEA